MAKYLFRKIRFYLIIKISPHRISRSIKNIRWRRVIIATLLSIIALLLLSEGILRLEMGNGAVGQMIDIERTGTDCTVQLHPNSSVMHTGLARRIPPTHESVNMYGYRGAAHGPEKKMGMFRFIIVGDSFTFCPGVEDGHDFPASLEKHLSEFRKGTQVLNFGVPSHNLDEVEKHFEQEALRFHPDEVILQIAQNDFAPSVCNLLSPTPLWFKKILTTSYLARELFTLYMVSTQDYETVSCIDRITHMHRFFQHVAFLSSKHDIPIRVIAFGDPIACGHNDLARAAAIYKIPFLPFPEDLKPHLDWDVGHLDDEGCDLYAHTLEQWIKADDERFNSQAIEEPALSSESDNQG